MNNIYFKATMILRCSVGGCTCTEEAEGIIRLTKETDIDVVPLYSLDISDVDQREMPAGWTEDRYGHYCPQHTSREEE